MNYHGPDSTVSDWKQVCLMDLPDLSPPPIVDDREDWAVGVMQGIGYAHSLVGVYADQLDDMQGQVTDQIGIVEEVNDSDGTECPECGQTDWFLTPSIDDPICESCGHIGVT